MIAVVKTGGKQYKVSTSEILKIERLNNEEGKTVEFKNVLNSDISVFSAETLGDWSILLVNFNPWVKVNNLSISHKIS